jgi:outer membrane immunogenic protein
MFKRSLCIAAVAAIGVSTAAYADGYGPGYAPPYYPTWTGFYVGVNGGYGWSNNDPVVVNFPTEGIVRRVTTYKLEPEGGFGGGQIGYNVQRGNIVFGVEADFQGAGINDKRSGSTSSGITETVSGELDDHWFGTIRGRVGYAFGSALIYGTGGFAAGGAQYKIGYTNPISPGGFLSKDETLTGWVAGAGIEYMVSRAWSVKAEYQHLDLGDIGVSGASTAIACAVPLCPFNSSHNVTLDTVRLGINYHLGTTDYVPLK